MKLRTMTFLLFVVYILTNGFTCKKENSVCDQFKVEIFYDDATEYINSQTTHGTAPFRYTWSNGLGSAASVKAPGPGTYSLTITDFNNCVGVSSVNVP